MLAKFQGTKIINIQSLKKLTNPKHMKKSIGIPTDTTTVHQQPNILEKIFNKKQQMPQNSSLEQLCRMLHCRAGFHDSLQLNFSLRLCCLAHAQHQTYHRPGKKNCVNCRFNRSICKTWMWSHWAPLWSF